MRFYHVGGSVRDRMMGMYPKDRDYVVTGATEQDMLVRGMSKVGADFPVFLDKNNEEWALARRERKTGSGYLGFETEFDTSVTIEEDLGRRDLTINSMAIEFFEDMKTRVVEVIDPFNGQEDLRNKVLRHTSDAFAEDPVRVLRLARFRARLGSDWAVAPETVALVSQMSKKGVLSELTAERVWKEMGRALMEPHPRLFFDTLLQTDALHTVFPEVYRLKTALEAHRWHPEGDAYEHSMLVLTAAAAMEFDLESRFAALVHDFGKGLTPRDRLPKHYGHDVKGVPVVESFSNRLTVPARMRDRAMKATRYHMYMHKLPTLNAKTVVKMFDDMGVNNDPDIVGVLHRVGCADERGRLGNHDANVDHLGLLFDMFDAYKSVKFNDVFPNGETNVNKIKQELFNARAKAVKGN